MAHNNVFLLAELLQIKREINPHNMCLFGDLISALTMFFILLAVVGLSTSIQETTASFFSFYLFFLVIAEMLTFVQVREQMGMY